MRSPIGPALRILVVLVGVIAAAGATAGTARADEAGVEILAVDRTGPSSVSAVVALPPALAEANPGADAFRVSEDGEPRPARVQPLPGDDLQVTLVIDTSGSMSGPAMAEAKAAATAFLGQLPASARIAVVGFGDTAVLASQLTSDRGALTAAIAGLTAKGETALYDGVDLALDQFDERTGVRRQVVLLSDGGDTASARSLDAARSRLAASDIRLDVAELGTSESRRDPLDTLAGAGRGSVVSAADPAALTAIYQKLARGLANQYRVEFSTTGEGPTQLQFTVEHGDRRASGATSIELPALEAGVTTSDESPAVPSGSMAALLAGAALCFAGLFLLTSLPSPRRARSRHLLRRDSEPGSLPALAAVRERAVAATDHALERHGQRRGLSAALERAGIALRPGEVVLGGTVVAGGSFAVAVVLSGVLVGAALAATVVLVMRVAVSYLARRRSQRFHDQLGDNLQLMAGGLRSGYAVLQAVDAVAKEAEAPSCHEFRRVIVESRLGRDLNASLRAMADRVGGQDVEWVAQAIEINREVGGDLAEILDSIAATIRDRARLRRHVRVVTAEGRVSAIVLVALPLLLAAVLSVMNPGYFGELTRGTGLVLSGVGAAMLAAGSLVMNRMVKVEY
jgi:tight adherence protein B